jgi:hypothetical protein
MTTNLRKSVLPSLAAPAQSSESAPATGHYPSPEASLSRTSQDTGTGIAEGVSQTNTDLSTVFRPTEAQSRVRAKFWARMADNPLLDPRLVTLSQAQQMTNSAALANWWGKPGFKDWFLSSTVVDERLDYLLHLALASAEDILLNTDPKAQSARVQMVKIVAEMAGRLKGAGAGPSSVNAADKKKKAIEAMGKEELVQFLQEQGLSVQQVVTIENK